MKKVSESIELQEDICEIIELTSNDIETLAKAFDLINEVCELRFDDKEESQIVVH
ncbi:MAG: hypothetical protein H6619_04640 [Deltaproteobacteria bacterium]|nr:hypothetical protein [Deltaproteobacteria bacterium]